MLYDSHIHCGLGQTFSINKDSLKEQTIKKGLKKMLEHYYEMGIDRLRDGGDQWGVGLLVKEISKETPVNFITPIQAIYKQGLYGDFLGQSVQNGKEGRQLIETLKKQKADFIKILLTGIMSFKEFGVVGAVQFSADELNEMVDCAHQAGLKTMVHVNSPEAIQMAIEAKVDTIEHGYCINEDCISALAQSETIWVPTLAPFANIANCSKESKMSAYRETSKKYFDQHRKAVKMANERGVKIALGSDSGATMVNHGQGTLDELNYLLECGLTKKQIQENGKWIFN